MGTATGLGGASGRYPTIVVVAQPLKEEEGIAWMIRTTIVTSTIHRTVTMKTRWQRRVFK